MYDIRGIAGEDITPELAFALGKAYGTLLREKGGKVVSVGRDVRHTSGDLEEGLIDGLRSVGVDVYEIGVVPTPVMYYSLFKWPVHGGIQESWRGRT